METRFLRSESPPEGRAKYRNNIPPTPLPFRLILTTPNMPFPNPDMRRQTAHRKLLEQQYPSTAGNCNSSHVSIPLMSSFIYYINWLPLQGLTQSSHKSIPVKSLQTAWAADSEDSEGP